MGGDDLTATPAEPQVSRQPQIDRRGRRGAVFGDPRLNLLGNTRVNFADSLADAIGNVDGHDASRETQNETSVAVSGSTVCVVWNDQSSACKGGANDKAPCREASECNGGVCQRQGTGFGRSTARGVPGTWEDRGQVFDRDNPPGESRGDPVLAADTAGRFYLAHQAHTTGTGADSVYVHVSPDCAAFPNPGFVASRRMCEGGANDRALCTADSACPSGQCKLLGVCQSGPNQGSVCKLSSECPPDIVGGCTIPALDKPWIAVDRSGGPFDGAVYVTWRDKAVGKIFLAASPPWTGALAFGPPIVVADPSAGPGGCQGGPNNGAPCVDDSQCPGGDGCGRATLVDNQVAVGPDGVVHVTWTDYVGGVALGPPAPPPNVNYRSGLPPTAGAPPALGAVELVRAVAIRPGAFDVTCTPKRSIPGLVAGAKNIRNVEFSTLAIDPVTGTPYVAWNEGNATRFCLEGPNDQAFCTLDSECPGGRCNADSDILFSQRVNGAWTPPVIVHHPDGDQFMPAMTVSPAGIIKIEYYDRSGQAAGDIVLSDAVSVGGLAWVNEVVSTAPFTLDAFVPQSGNCYMGDYNGITAGADGFYHVWGDNRESKAKCGGGPNDGAACNAQSECPGGACHTPNPGGHFDPNVFFDFQPTEFGADDTGCVSDTLAHKTCSDKFANAFAKYIKAVSKCHCKQAKALFKGKLFNEENCEGIGPTGNGALGKFLVTRDALVLSGSCHPRQIDFADQEMAKLSADKSVPASLDAQNGVVFCDPTSGIMIATSDFDDAGFVPAAKAVLKCACAVGKNLSKLAAAAIECHKKMNDALFNGAPFDEGACEEANLGGTAAQQVYGARVAALLGRGICPACLALAGQSAAGNSVIDQVDGANMIAYPCLP